MMTCKSFGIIKSIKRYLSSKHINVAFRWCTSFDHGGGTASCILLSVPNIRFCEGVQKYHRSFWSTPQQSILQGSKVPLQSAFHLSLHLSLFHQCLWVQSSQFVLHTNMLHAQVLQKVSYSVGKGLTWQFTDVYWLVCVDTLLCNWDGFSCFCFLIVYTTKSHSVFFRI